MFRPDGMLFVYGLKCKRDDCYKRDSVMWCFYYVLVNGLWVCTVSSYGGCLVESLLVV